MFNKYPYLNLNDLNLDYILKKIKEMETELNTFVSTNAIKYANPIDWNITTQYEKNTVVIDANSGIAYLSVQPVPSGVAITNTDYWTVIFDLSMFIDKAAKNLTFHVEGITNTATFDSNVDDWLIWYDVLYKAVVYINTGDSYVVGSNIVQITVEDVIKAIIGEINNLTTNVVNLLADVSELQDNTKLLDLERRVFDYDNIEVLKHEIITTGYYSYEECMCFNPITNKFLIGINDTTNNLSKIAIYDINLNYESIVTLPYNTINAISFDPYTNSIIVCYGLVMRMLDPATLADIGEFDWLDTNEMCQYFQSIDKYITGTYLGSVVKFNIYNPDRELEKSFSVDVGINLDGFNQYWVWNGCIYTNTIGYYFKISLDDGALLDMQYSRSLFEIEGMTEFNNILYGVGHIMGNQAHTDVYFLKYDGYEKPVNLGIHSTNVVNYTGDLNDLRNPGFYYCDASCTNKPSEITTPFGMIITGQNRYTYPINRCRQVIVHDNKLWVREINSYTYDSWRKIVGATNLRSDISWHNDITTNLGYIDHYIDDIWCQLFLRFTVDNTIASGSIIFDGLAPYISSGNSTAGNRLLLVIDQVNKTIASLAYTEYDSLTQKCHIKTYSALPAGPYMIEAVYRTEPIHF